MKESIKKLTISLIILIAIILVGVLSYFFIINKNHTASLSIKK